MISNQLPAYPFGALPLPFDLELLLAPFPVLGAFVTAVAFSDPAAVCGRLLISMSGSLSSGSSVWAWSTDSVAAGVSPCRGGGDMLSAED